MLFRQLVFYALLIGAGGGLALTAVQSWQVIPLIHSAEHFEEHLRAGTQAHPGHGAAQSSGDHAHAGAMQRTGLTLLANSLMGIGFALLLMVAMVLARDHGGALSWRHALLWGGAGYAVFFLVPALGQPPDIPGAVSASLESRQLWWLLAAGCTAGALAVVTFVRSPWRWAGLALVFLPYLVGAPQAPVERFAHYPPAMAAELELIAQQFFAATAVANAAFWLALAGGATAALRCMEQNPPAGAGATRTRPA